MDTYCVMRRVFFAMCLLAVPALAGCQTVAGFGRDVQHAGRWISGGAEGTEAWIFGPQDQAAEAQNTNGSMGGDAGVASQKSMTPVARVSDAGDNVVYFATGSADIPPDAMGEIRSIATASLKNSGDGSGNASLQGADTSSMQSSNGSSGQNANNMSQQSATNGSGQNTSNVSGQSARRFQVIGYTDTAGSAAYNRKLSERRAQAVADALVAEGVPRASLDVQWHGEDQLPVPTADGVPEPQNRRVSIAMTGG